MKIRIAFFLLSCFVLFFGCQKEYSYETSVFFSAGVLQSAVSGDCFPKTVTGVFEAAKVLVGAANFIQVEVNVTKTGAYTIYTDTVNGYYFRATGVFATTGTNQVKLSGIGTPGSSGVNNFVVHYGMQECIVAVTVQPASAGPAVGTLSGGPGTCASFTLNGTYAVGQVLTPGHNVQVQLNITTGGSHSITTDTVAGFWFSAAGTVATGNSTVTLNGSGIPSTGGSKTFTVKFGSSTCIFTVNVGSAGIGTLGGAGGTCTPVTVNGTYTAGTALSSMTNTIAVQVNVTTPGTFSITTNTVNGYGFAFSGNLTTSGTVILVGSGTPGAVGSNTFIVTLNATPLSTCTFNITIGGTTAANGTLGGNPGTCSPATVNGVYVVGTALTTSNVILINATVTTAGTYSITTNTIAGFSFSGSGNLTVGPGQVISLTGAGAPTTVGPHVFTVAFGTSSCTFTVYVVANDYFPRTTNSNWSYELDDNVNDSLYRNVIAATHLALGNTYNIFLQKDGITPPPDSSGYYRRNSGDYFEWFDAGTWLSYDNPRWGEYLMLKDNVPASPGAGSNWKTPVNGFAGTISMQPIIIRFSYTVTDKDIAVSFTTSTGTMNFSNVIVVQEKLEAFVGTNWQDITATINYYGKSYYARGVGLIKFDAYNSSNTITFKQELRRFQVF